MRTILIALLMTLATQVGATTYHAFSCDLLYNGKPFLISDDGEVQRLVKDGADPKVNVRKAEKNVFVFNNPETPQTQVFLRKFDQVWKLILVELGQVDEVECEDLSDLSNELASAIDATNMSTLSLEEKELLSKLKQKDEKIKELKASYQWALRQVSDLKKEMRQLERNNKKKVKRGEAVSEVLCSTLRKLAIGEEEAYGVPSKRRFHVGLILTYAQMDFEQKYDKSTLGFAGICNKDWNLGVD